MLQDLSDSLDEPVDEKWTRPTSQLVTTTRPRRWLSRQKERRVASTVPQKFIQDLRACCQILLQAASVRQRQENRSKRVERPTGLLLQDEVPDLVPDGNLVGCSWQDAMDLVLSQDSTGLELLGRQRLDGLRLVGRQARSVEARDEARRNLNNSGD